MESLNKYPLSILCVDDEPANLELLKRHLLNRVESIDFAGNGEDGYNMYCEKQHDIIITDLVMPIVDGLQMCQMIRHKEHKVPIILMTSSNGSDFLEEAIDIGVTQFLPKPILKDKLLRSVQRCYETIYIERKLFQSQKMESLEFVAAGIAHTFNNILAVIIGKTQITLMRMPQDSPFYDSLHDIDEAAKRAAGIAKQMLDYTSKGFFKLQKVNLNSLVINMKEIFLATVSEQVKIDFCLPESLPPIKGEPSQLRQIFTTLLINAYEAITPNEGKIGISTGVIDCDSDYIIECFNNNDLSEGEYVYFEISDTGCGMTKDVITKLFDPFFSTKFMGRGLGMASLFGIVRAHKGGIHVNSKPDQGSKVRVFFPVMKETQIGLMGNNHA